MKVRVEKTIGASVFSIETGLLAKQAAGSCLVQYGETIVVTAVTTGPPRGTGDFFPLTCDYRERTAAAGKFPGGFLKRESRPTTKETLTSRLMDRPIRPLFPAGFLDEVQIQSFVLSSDRQNDGDVLAMNGAAAGLGLSPLPFQGPIGSVRLGQVGGKFIPFPTQDELEESDLDLIVSGSKDSILMIEGFAREMREDRMVEAILEAHRIIREICDLQNELFAKVGVQKPAYVPAPADGLYDQLMGRYQDAFRTAKRTEGKQARAAAVKAVKQQVFKDLIPDPAAPGAISARRSTTPGIISKSIWCAKRFLAGTRPDGRDYKSLRAIECHVDVLPRVHGSAIFQRGETQALITVTLGTSRDEQRVDGLIEEYSKKFMLDYYFPPFSVGETKPIRGPGRREIGHGALAERSIKPVLPDPEEFPYTIRVISDILESNGSSSMASVCGATLGLMAAGVKITQSGRRHFGRAGERIRLRMGSADRHHRRRRSFRRHGFQSGRHAKRHHRHPARPEDRRHQRRHHPGHARSIARSSDRDSPQDAHDDSPSAERDFALGAAAAADARSIRKRSARSSVRAAR